MSRYHQIIIKHNSLKEIGPILSAINPYKVGIITCERLSCIWLNELLNFLSEYSPEVFILPDGEEVKSLETAVKLWKWLIEKRFTRKSVLIGFGGGSICDISGFVASTYMRGIPLILIPTTLTAQVDASIGGKTSINLLDKNIIGTFYPANVIIIDPKFLRTLSDEDFRSGLAEVIKYGVIKDIVLFNFLTKISYSTLRSDLRVLMWLIKVCVKNKVEVIEKDFKERNFRMILNFGHTIGHAIEKLLNYRIRHGFAIAIGMAINCKIAEELLGFNAEPVINLLKSFNLPIKHGLNPLNIIHTMKNDKKAWYGKPVMILPKKIGHVVITEVPTEIIIKKLRDMR